MPEVVRLPGLAVKPGARVAKQGDKAAGFYVVTAPVNGKKVVIVPERGGTEETAAKDDLVVVKRFGEPMYPSLIPVAKVTRAPGRPYHTLINADNFHALQLLLYSHEGDVDVIYIDPPYNTGARDWKYNNDFVDQNDHYRHSNGEIEIVGRNSINTTLCGCRCGCCCEERIGRPKWSLRLGGRWSVDSIRILRIK